MSLINKMLQDLDARGTPNTQAGLGHAQVRVVAARPGWGRGRLAPLPKLLLSVLALLVLGAAGFFAWRQLHAPKRMVPAVRAGVPLKPALPPAAAAASAAPAAALAPLKPAAASAAAPATLAAGASVPVSSAPLAAPAAAATNRKLAPHAAGARLPASGVAKTADAAIIVNAKLQGKELTTAQRAESEYRRGTNYLQQGRVTEAISSLNQALQIEPGHDAARQTLVGLLVEAQRTDEAMQRLQEGLALNRNQPELAMLLARLYVDRNDVRSALDVLQKSAAGATGRADYLAFQAALLQRDKRHKEAVEHYMAALRINSRNGVWWMGLGISLQADGRMAEAREAFARAKSSNTLSADLLSFVEQKITQLSHLP